MCLNKTVAFNKRYTGWWWSAKRTNKINIDTFVFINLKANLNRTPNASCVAIYSPLLPCTSPIIHVMPIHDSHWLKRWMKMEMALEYICIDRNRLSSRCDGLLNIPAPSFSSSKCMFTLPIGSFGTVHPNALSDYGIFIQRKFDPSDQRHYQPSFRPKTFPLIPLHWRQNFSTSCYNLIHDKRTKSRTEKMALN